MSPSVNNFVTDLVEMAKAMEENPKLHDRISQLEAACESYRQNVQRLEGKLLDSGNERDTLTQKLRAAEDARDAASFRLLEVEEAFGKVSSLVGQALASTDAVNKVLNPPPPVEVRHEAPPAPHQPSPIPSVSDPEGLMPGSEVRQDQPVEVAAPRPTTSVQHGDGSSGMTSATSSATEAATSDDKPFAGKRWDSIFGGSAPGYRTLHAKWHDASWSKDRWLEGGGSERGWDNLD